MSQRVALPVSLLGLDERPILQQEIAGLTVVFSECDAEKVALTRENVLRHDAVVRSALEHETPLPFRFGHLVTLEQISSYVESKSEMLQARLQHLLGRVEMSAKIIWNRENILIGNKNQTQTVPSNTGKGVAFLMSKRAELQEEEALSSEAEAVATWLKSEISGLVCDERVVLRPTEKLVLSASFLVDRSKLEAYRKRTVIIKDSRPDLHFLRSGPWPPYSFSNNDLEFKTHLGVS